MEPSDAGSIAWTLSVPGGHESQPSGPRLDLRANGDNPGLQTIENERVVAIVLRHPWCDVKLDETPGRDLLSRHQDIGLSALGEVRGEATILLWEKRPQRLIVARAPGSLQPIYFSLTDRTLWISNDIRTLIREGGIPATPNVQTLSGYLAAIWPSPESTFFDSVRRVPPTQALTWSHGEVDLSTYWNPVPDRETVEWIGPEALDQFGTVFETAVDECLGNNQAGIFLSGGLDSVSVAAMAQDLTQRQTSPAPLALSLVFPDPDCNEESAQRAIAHQLDLDQVILGFEETLAGKSPMSATLELTAKRPFPVLNFWQPAYLELARRAADRGCHHILTGNGGDEWLTVTPLLAADLWKRFDLLDLGRFWNSLRRSYRLSNPRMTYNLLWLFGIRTLLADFSKTQLEQRTPRRLRQLQLRRMRRKWKPWLSQDAAVFQPLTNRARQTSRDDRLSARSGGYYLREMRTGLDHFLVSHELDEIALLGRETGTLVRQPFMHPELISFLIRVHPEVLAWKGRSKGLIRESVSRRFPDLGFQSQRKILSTGYYRRSLLRDLNGAWRTLAGTPALDELAITDPTGVKSLAEEVAQGCRDHRKVHDLWSIINLETWLRAWI